MTTTMASGWIDMNAGDDYRYSRFTGTLFKPDLDDRDYRVIELQNGLKAILVHDPSADQAAASLTIAVGGTLDPVSVRREKLDIPES